MINQDEDELRARIDDIFNGATTLEEIREVFSFDHEYQGKKFTASVVVSVGSAEDFDIVVRGKFECTNGDPRDAGMFYRRFYVKRAILFAHHAFIGVAPPYQEHLLATTHYVKALRWYAKVGVLCVTLEADQDGPTVWPGFSFTLLDSDDRDRLEEIVRQMLGEHLEKDEIEELISRAGSFTPYLAEIVVVPKGGEDDVPVGLLALRRLYEEKGGALRMAAWLDHGKAKAFLAEAGIMDEEVGKEDL